MTSASSNLLMIGLRGSGKTSYLAALWHYLESGEVSDSLTIAQLQPNRDYLNAIRANWLAFKEVGRTSMQMEEPVTLEVLDQETDASITISLPDLSGESYRLQWANRRALKAYVDFASQCTGAFLFIHPKEVRRTHVIIAKDANSELEDGPKISPSPNWSPTQSATQVQLVDLLQILLALRKEEGPLRLAVVISAWDLVKARVSPKGWLESRLPLLSQYLSSNPALILSEVFGVSAQGGDLESDKRALEENPIASSRGHAVIGNNLDRENLSKPLSFLLRGVV